MPRPGTIVAIDLFTSIKFFLGSLFANTLPYLQNNLMDGEYNGGKSQLSSVRMIKGKLGRLKRQLISRDSVHSALSNSRDFEARRASATDASQHGEATNGRSSETLSLN